ncbi:hypothetical protein ACVII0_000085 [Sinorhizobium meliloti]
MAHRTEFLTVPFPCGSALQQALPELQSVERPSSTHAQSPCRLAGRQNTYTVVIRAPSGRCIGRQDKGNALDRLPSTDARIGRRSSIRSTGSGRLALTGSIALTVCIDGKLLLIASVYSPVDITFMVILQKNIIFVEWPDVAVRLVSAAIDDCGSALAFAIGVSSSIKRVLQYRDHIAIADWRPIERRQFLPSEGRGKCIPSRCSARWV